MRDKLAGWVSAVDRKLETALSVGLYVYIISVIFAEVIARYVFESSILWASETAIYAFIWLTYISMAGLARSRSHLAFTALRDVMSPLPQLLLLLLSDACLLVLSVVIIVFIYQPIADNIVFEQQMMGVNLPLWLATAAVPFGWVLVVIRTIQRALDTIRDYRAGRSLVTGIAALE